LSYAVIKLQYSVRAEWLHVCRQSRKTHGDV